MNKQEFISNLRERLCGLPTQELEDRLHFYGEIIDDQIEEGLGEEEAVAAIGSVEEVATQILAQIPLTKIIKDKIKPAKRLKAWEIVLLVLGSPVWLSLLVAAAAVLLSLYVSWWAVLVSLWASFAGLGGSALGGGLAGVFFAFGSAPRAGLCLIAASLVCAGLCLFAFWGCVALTRLTLRLTPKIILGMKKCFIKKEDVVCAPQ